VSFRADLLARARGRRARIVFAEGEDPRVQAAAERLRTEAIVIGSDQVAELAGAPIGKPGSHERAVAQLRAMSGRTVAFHTAVAVVRRDRHYERGLVASVRVSFRTLDDAQIEHYLKTARTESERWPIK
jgi:septum formation protein